MEKKNKFMVKIMPNKLVIEDYFKDDIELENKTDLKRVFYGDMYHPKPTKFMNEVINNKEYPFVSDVRYFNYYLDISSAGKTSLLGILNHCQNNGWLNYSIIEPGSKVSIEKKEGSKWYSSEIVVTRKIAKIESFNEYSYREYTKYKKWSVIKNILSFLGFLIILFLTILSILVTINV